MFVFNTIGNLYKYYYFITPPYPPIIKDRIKADINFTFVKKDPVTGEDSITDNFYFNFPAIVKEDKITTKAGGIIFSELRTLLKDITINDNDKIITKAGDITFGELRTLLKDFTINDNDKITTKAGNITFGELKTLLIEAVVNEELTDRITTKAGAIVFGELIEL